jgi:hypothetical protein
MQKLFDPVIANITELITQQVKEVQRTQKATIDVRSSVKSLTGRSMLTDSSV